MVRYRRNLVPGGCYFFTVALADRRASHLTTHIDALRDAVRTKRRFEIDAMVILPDHLHAMFTLPEGDADFAHRGRRIKTVFTQRLIKDGVALVTRPTDWPHSSLHRYIPAKASAPPDRAAPLPPRYASTDERLGAHEVPVKKEVQREAALGSADCASLMCPALFFVGAGAECEGKHQEPRKLLPREAGRRRQKGCDKGARRNKELQSRQTPLLETRPPRGADAPTVQ